MLVNLCNAFMRRWIAGNHFIYYQNEAGKINRKDVLVGMVLASLAAL